MKKTIYYISVILLGFTSCTKDEVPNAPVTLGVRQVADNLMYSYDEAARLVQILEVVDEWNRAETSDAKTKIAIRYFGELSALKNYGDSIVISDFGTVITGGNAFNEPNAQWLYKEVVVLSGNNMSETHKNTFTVQRIESDKFHIAGKDLYRHYLKNSYSIAFDVERTSTRICNVAGTCDMEVPNYWSRAVSTTELPLSLSLPTGLLAPLAFRGAYSSYSSINSGLVDIDLYRPQIEKPDPAQVEFNKDAIIIRYAGVTDSYNKHWWSY